MTRTVAFLLVLLSPVVLADDLKERVDSLVSELADVEASSLMSFGGIPQTEFSRELISIGMDAVPYLVPHLSDKRLTNSWREHGSGRRRRVSVNEYVGHIITRCCKHYFYIASGEDIVMYLGQQPLENDEHIELFKEQVKRWHFMYGRWDEGERSIKDINDWFHYNRFGAYEFFERTGDPRGRTPLERRILFLLNNGSTNSTSRSEMVACAEALASIGDERSIPSLRSVWQDLFDRPIDASARIPKLFRLYRARVRIDDGDQALEDLNAYRERYYASLDKSSQREFDEEYDKIEADDKPSNPVDS